MLQRCQQGLKKRGEIKEVLQKLLFTMNIFWYFIRGEVQVIEEEKNVTIPALSLR